MDRQREFNEMDKLFDELFPILRSITGEGLRKSLKILQKVIPIEIKSVPSGKQVFDWTVPDEWQIKEAWIKNSKGEKIIDIKKNNLHVLNYSIAVDKKVTLDELKKNVYTKPELPDAIPYVTAYYTRAWGFCMSHNQLALLPEDEYHVYIDASHFKGELNYGEYVLPGETDKEILLNTYICHPSMANNELSGPIVTAFLYKRLLERKRRFTYRFIFIPETIGSIVFLHEKGQYLKGKLHTGLVLTCLGEDKPLSLKKPRIQDSPIESIYDNFSKYRLFPVVTRDFTPLYGSDERQYCSPGFNLPVGQLSRGLHSIFDTYHTSLDNKEFMSIEALQRSVNEIEQILCALEIEGYYINKKPYGEVFMSNLNIYPTISAKRVSYDKKMIMYLCLYLLNYCDGVHLLSDLASNMGFNMLSGAFQKAFHILRDNDLIDGPYTDKKEDPFN